jgi:hypothetical protein
MDGALSRCVSPVLRTPIHIAESTRATKNIFTYLFSSFPKSPAAEIFLSLSHL